LEQLDYFQDLNRVLFSNVVDQAAQETAYWSAYTTWGVINKPAAATKSLAYISLLQRLDAIFHKISSLRRADPTTMVVIT
jgi:hypothetical protein